jgi:hypothetical protein
MVFHSTSNNTSAISWWSVLLMVKTFLGQWKIRVTGPNGIMVAQTFCDIFCIKKRHQISIYKQFSD